MSDDAHGTYLLRLLDSLLDELLPEPPRCWSSARGRRQLRPELALSNARPRLHHVRTEQGRQEVDLVVELAGGGLIGIEIKASASPDRGDAKHLLWLREQLGERFIASVVLHTGPRIYPLAEKMLAAPISVLWGKPS